MHSIQMATSGVVKQKHGLVFKYMVDILGAFKYSITALLTVNCGQRKQECEQTSSLVKAISIH